MLKRTKRFLGIFITLCMLLSLVPMVVSAAGVGETFTYGDFNYKVNADGATVTITSIAASALTGEVTVPEKVSDGSKEYTVTQLADAFKNQGAKTAEMTKLTLPDTITTFTGTATFYGCKFTSIHLPASLTGRLTKTFYFCSKLSTVTLPAGVTECYGTFGGGNDQSAVSGVMTVYITGKNAVSFFADSATIEARAWKNGTTPTIYYPYDGTEPVRYKANGSFNATVIKQDPPSTTFTCGDFNYETNGDGAATATLVSIAAEKLEGDVVVPEKVSDGSREYTVTRLGGAFKATAEPIATKVAGITSLTLPDTITRITVTGAFYGNKFSKIHLPENLTNAGQEGFLYNTFQWCSKLESVTIPAGITYCWGTFQHSGVKDVIIVGLKAVEFYEGSSTEGARAWNGASGVKITYPENGTAPLRTGAATVIHQGAEPVVTAFEDGEFGYSIINDTKTVQVTGFSTISDKAGAKVLPETAEYDGTEYTVVSVASQAFKDATELTSFTMADTVTTVGSGLFYGCKNLEYVHLSDNLTNAAAGKQLVGTFQYCTSLKTVIIPAGIGCLPTTFRHSGVENVVLRAKGTEIPKGGENQYVPFDDPDKVNVFYPSDGSIYGGYAPYLKHIFIYNDTIAYKIKDDNSLSVVSALPGYTLPEDVVIPATIGALEVNEIEEGAFYDEDGIVSVTIPDSVKTVGEGAFAGCDSLESVTLSKGIEGELVNTFADCTSLKSVTIPEGVTALDGTFNGCTVLENIKFAQSLTALKNKALYGTALDNIPVPDSITTFDDGENEGGTIFPTGCTIIVRAGSAALAYAIEKDVQYIIKPDVEYVEKGGKAELKKAWFRLVGEYEVPETVEIDSTTYDVVSIADNAFENQDALTVLSIPDALNGITGDSFNGCTNEDFAVRVNSKTAAYAAVKAIPVNFIADDEATGFAYKKYAEADGWEIYGSANDATLSGAVNIAAFDGVNVTSIGEGAFLGQTGITSVTMANTVTNIGKSAFAGCTALTEATLSENAEGMLDSTFEGCASLENISIPTGITELKNTYNGCVSLVRVIIPENITAIYDKTFANCTGLETVVIPETVTTFDRIVSFKDETQEEAEYVNTNRGKKWVDNPFMGATNEYLAICGVRGSAAEEFAYSSGIKFIDVTEGDYPVEYTSVKDKALDVSVRDIYGSGDVALVVALYEDSRLINCETIEAEFDGTTVCAQKVELPDYADGDTVKVFLWDSVTSIKPIVEPMEVKEPEKIKIMILGNSISNHGPSATNGWFPVAPDPDTNTYQAMASTSPDKDFAHIVLNKARSVNKNAEVKIVTCWSLESDFDQWQTIIPRDYKDAIDYDADIIIAQFGENIKSNSGEGAISGSFDNDHEFTPAIFEGIVKSFIKKGKNVPVVVITSMMDNKSDIINAKQKAAADNGWATINLCNDPNFSESKNSAYYLTPNQIVEGLANGTFHEGVEIGSGVYVHPGNNGMRAMGYNLWRYIEPIVKDMTFNK